MKINENSEGTGRIAGSDQQILRFRKFRKKTFCSLKFGSIHKNNLRISQDSGATLPGGFFFAQISD